MNLMWSKLIHVILIFLIITPLLSGCWDRMELDERGIVLGIGIDTAKEKRHQDASSYPANTNVEKEGNGLIKITAQIAVPGRIPLGPGEGGGGGGGEKTVWAVEAVGDTLADAINVLQQRISRPLFFGHLRIVVIAESVARNGIEDLNDYLHRNSEVRRTIWMVVCKGDASKVINASPQLERSPTLYLVSAMDDSVKIGRLPNDFVGVFLSAITAKGKSGYLPYIEMEGNDIIQISGLALFKRNKMVQTTNATQILYYMGIVGLKNGGGEVYVKPKGSNDFFLFQARFRNSSIKVDLQNGLPYVKVRTTIEGNILDKTNETSFINTKTILAIEKQLEEQLSIGYKDLIKKTQVAGTDIFGFGENIRARLPNYWNENISTEDNWIKQYKQLKIDVAIDMHVRRVGMKAN